MRWQCCSSYSSSSSYTMAGRDVDELMGNQKLLALRMQQRL
jgi:hypothetical protein